MFTFNAKNTLMSTQKQRYHHGHLSESLLQAVDDISSQFGIEAVTLRACAKKVGVSPGAAFRHFQDKRALLTAFAARALNQLADTLDAAEEDARETGNDAFYSVGMAYLTFALENPALFRAMWREETIYSKDPDYLAAAKRLVGYLKEGFAGTITDEDPKSFSAHEMLAWSSVHGMANLFVDGPIAAEMKQDQKLELAKSVIGELKNACSQA